MCVIIGYQAYLSNESLKIGIIQSLDSFAPVFPNGIFSSLQYTQNIFLDINFIVFMHIRAFQINVICCMAYTLQAPFHKKCFASVFYFNIWDTPKFSLWPQQPSKIRFKTSQVDH